MPGFKSPSMPPIVSHIFSTFPLVTYPSPTPPTSAPSSPTIWLLSTSTSSPSSSSPLESQDPTNRAIQALARFRGVKLETRWWTTPLGAPNGELPSLHLPNGDLLPTNEIEEWITKEKKNKEGGEEKVDATNEAYVALLSTTLLPAVLASLYLSEHTTVQTSKTKDPLLRRWWSYYSSFGERRGRIEQIQRLRVKKVGKTALDLEEVERDGIETIAALEQKLKSDNIGKDDWFGNAAEASMTDASIYALLSIVLHLSPTDPLREKLERNPTLLAWVKAKESKP